MVVQSWRQIDGSSVMETDGITVKEKMVVQSWRQMVVQL